MRLAPIVLFVYNRPEHTKKTVEALQKNKLAKDSLLYVFSDGPKNEEAKEKVKEVREYIKKIKGFRKVEVFESDKNKGLANSVIAGVTKIIDKHGRVIVLEDDCVSSPDLLNFSNRTLDFYEKNKKIYSITNFNYSPSILEIPGDYKFDVYFSLRAGAQSWATWKDRWETVDWEVEDFDVFKKDKKLQKKFNQGGDDMSEMLINQMEGKIDSWAIRWGYHHFLNNAFCVYPVDSLIDNIGCDGSGVHSGVDRRGRFRNELKGKSGDFSFPQKVQLNDEIVNNFKNIFARDKKYYLKKFIKKIIFYNKWKDKI